MAAPASPSAPHAGHVPALDGLRGLAALLVLIAHVSPLTGLGADLFRAGGGQLGVMLFFALSGFLMAHVYWRSTPSPRRVWTYAVARVARVVPLYLVVVLASYTVTTLCADGPACPRAYEVTDTNLADHLLLKAGVNVLWTIPVEMRFYLLFPLFWLAFALSRGLGATLIAGLLLAYAIVPGGQMPVMKLGHYFLIGVGVWMVWRAVARSDHDACSSKMARAWNAAFSLSGLAVLAMLPGLFTVLFDRPPTRMWWEPQIAVAVAALLLTSAASPLAGRLLGAAPMRWLGRVSYSLYLTHVLVLMNLKPWLDPARHPVVFFALAGGLSLGLAALSFRVVERPGQRLVRAALMPSTWRPAPRMAAS